MNNYKKETGDYTIDTQEELDEWRRNQTPYDDHLEQIEDKIKEELR